MGLLVQFGERWALVDRFDYGIDRFWIGHLTRRQYWLSKHGKSRVRKKWQNVYKKSMARQPLMKPSEIMRRIKEIEGGYNERRQ